MNATAILDEYCRYYSDFSKILSIYTKNYHPQLQFEYEQLLQASYNIWHRLTNDKKISLTNFLEDIIHENYHASSKITTCTKEFHVPIDKSKAIALNTNSNKMKKSISMTPFHIYLKDERRKLINKHRTMSMNEINKRLSERWKKMSNRMKQTYEYRSYLAKKRLYKKQGKLIKLKKPSFIKRKSFKTKQIQNKNQHLSNACRT